MNSSVNETKLAPYNFSIGNVMKEGWQRTSGFKLKLWGAFLTYMILNFLLYMGLGFLHPAHDNLSAIFSLIGFLIIYPMVIGIYILGVKRSVDQPIKVSMMFDYYHAIFRVDITFILAYIITVFFFGVGIFCVIFGAHATEVGMRSILLLIGGLFLLIGAYLVLAYVFATTLSALKKLNPWTALETSRKGISKHWFKVFFLYLFVSVIIIVSAIPFGIGLIWTLPWSNATLGVLYRDLFGVNPGE